MNAFLHKYKHILGGTLLLAVVLFIALSLWNQPNTTAETTDLTVGIPIQEDGEGETEAPADESTPGEDGQSASEDAPEGSEIVRGLIEVVVADVPIPVGTTMRAELLKKELRPSDNVAVRAGVTFSDPDLLVGQIARTNIARGQEILAPMIALSPTDIASFGSDLSIFVNQGNVAVGFPVNQYSGVGYTMRPGDFVDVLMSFNMLELDIDFQTPLPNLTQLVNEEALLAGEAFLFPAVSQGRLEFITEINKVAEITPREINLDQPVSDDQLEQTIATQEPRRVTQMTIQQAEVLWSGDWETDIGDQNWLGPRNEELLNDLNQSEGREREQAELFLESVSNRVIVNPDLVILSMPVQDALVLKWSYEQPGVESALVLRAQGDNALYFTTSVSLPQLVEQAGLSIPEPGQFGIDPEIEPREVPRLEFFPVEATNVEGDQQSNSSSSGED
jgi:Flp pilus assembly protein CpaB